MLQCIGAGFFSKPLMGYCTVASVPLSQWKTCIKLCLKKIQKMIQWFGSSWETMLTVVCGFKMCRKAALGERWGKRFFKKLDCCPRMSTRYLSFSLSRSRPYPLKKPFPLGNEEGELLNPPIVFLIIGKLEKKFTWRLKIIFNTGKGAASVGNYWEAHQWRMIWGWKNGA